MNNLTNTTKIILFAGIIATMILPFSVIEMAEAANEKKEKHEIKKYPKNTKADEIFAKLAPYKIAKIGEEKKYSAKDLKEIDTLEKALEKSQQDYKKKHIDKELQKKLKEAQKLIHTSNVPVLVSAIGFDHVYIQLAQKDVQVENKISTLMEEIPYVIEYGEGFQRLSGTGTSNCQTPQSDCDPEIGGIAFQTSALNSCTLSVPMQMNGVDGFQLLVTVFFCRFIMYINQTYGMVY